MRQDLHTLLQALAASAAPPLLVGAPDGYTTGVELCAQSLLQPLLCSAVAPAEAPAWAAALVQQLVGTDVAMDRAAGALVGLAIGDGVGAPLEFLAVDSTPASAEERRVAGLSTALQDDGTLRYYGERNKFGLRRGQWTDDTAMALCLADSLLVHGQYHGGDCRIRFFNWWYYGYNNGFASDPCGVRRSVGLGSTIGRSLDELLDHEGADARNIPWRYLGGGSDAGNGSLMRLAPVAIRYARAPARLLESAAEQSLATHPGSDATVCCLFLAYAMAAALTRPAAAPASLGDFLAQVIEGFLAEVGESAAWREHASMHRLAALLRHQPPAASEAHWDWHAAELPLAAALQARAGRYQGHAVDSAYFGSYSMDGLAMALWALRPAASFSDAMLRVVNLLGDADSTGAICGQLAGAWFGLSGVSATALGQRMHDNVRAVDPYSEIALRALLLSAQSCGGQ